MIRASVDDTNTRELKLVIVTCADCPMRVPVGDTDYRGIPLVFGLNSKCAITNQHLGGITGRFPNHCPLKERDDIG